MAFTTKWIQAPPGGWARAIRGGTFSYEQDWSTIIASRFFTERNTPAEGWHPVAKAIIADVINAVGAGKLEEGVYDRPVTEPDPVFTGSGTGYAGKVARVLAGSKYKIPGATVGYADVPIFEGEFGPPYAPGEEERDMSHDWGHLIRQGVETFTGVGKPLSFSGDYPSYPSGPGYDTEGNGKVTVDTRTGKVTKCRRRRRRRLLTPTDLNDLAALKTIVGGGQAMNFAVLKAVRR